MRALIQRVSQARVAVKNKNTGGKIGPGLLILLGISKTDTSELAAKLAEKTANLRIFSNDQGKFDLSLLDTKGSALVVSQFTLYGDTAKGRRPDFTQAAVPENARPLYEEYIKRLRDCGVINIEEGEFQAHMEISLTNDGPVTIMLEI